MLWALDGGVEVGWPLRRAGPEDPGIKPIVEAIHSVYVPCRVLWWRRGPGGPPLHSLRADGWWKAGPPSTCRRQTCSPPLTDPQEAAALLREA